MQYSGLFRLAKKPSELKNNVGGPVMLVSMAMTLAAAASAASCFLPRSR
jgi:hypothetical protein